MGSISPPPPTAIVKGAGPSGLAAAIALAQEGFDVTVVEKRPERPHGQGRQNMVALRPEALHQLDILNVLPSLDAAHALTPMTRGRTAREDDGSVFNWPLDTQVRYPLPHANGNGDSKYVPPEKLDDQVPSSYVTLGQLEDAMSAVAIREGVAVRYDSTVRLQQASGSDAFETSVLPSLSGASATKNASPPDLIVIASGKGDKAIQSELSFQPTIGNKLDDSILPLAPSRDLRLGPANEVESQKFCVFGVRTPAAEMGIIQQVVRNYGSEPQKPQPVVEIEMRHAEASHCLLQLPRGFPHTDAGKLETYILERVNQRLGTSFASVQEMKDRKVVVWGEPLVPVTVETAIAPRFVFGSNVVLVGDAGMSCSPSSGLGAEVGLTHDVQGIRGLAKSIAGTRGAEREKEKEKEKDGALDAFNLHKAKGAVMWSKGSSWFYISKEEADKFVQSSSTS